MASQRSTVESFFMRAWARRGLLACLLWPLSLLFGAVSTLRQFLYARGVIQSVRLPVPVIVIGNIFVGGTGKTPLTIWLVETLRKAGYVPGVISRGYGAHNDVPCAVFAHSSPHEVGDEPVLIAMRTKCPVMVARNRVAAAKALLARHPEVNLIVSDDGLQHYALQRNVEIVLCDARGNGNGWLLPAGPLREPASRRRDLTVINGAEGTERPPHIPADAILMQLAGDSAERLIDRTQRVPLHALMSCGADGRMPRIVAAAGIGNPSRFFLSLRSAGLQFEEMPLPDHFDFAIDPFAQSGADLILITEKDAVKCVHHDALKSDARIWVVPVDARISSALAEKIVEMCRG